MYISWQGISDSFAARKCSAGDKSTTGESIDCSALDGIGVAEQQPRTGATIRTVEAIRAIVKCFKVYMTPILAVFSL